MSTTGKTTLSEELSSPSSGVPTDRLTLFEGEALGVTEGDIDEDAVVVGVTDVVGVLVPVTDGVLVGVTEEVRVGVSVSLEVTEAVDEEVAVGERV